MNLQEWITQAAGRRVQNTNVIANDQGLTAHAVVIGAAIELHTNKVGRCSHARSTIKDQATTLCLEGNTLIRMDDQGNRCCTDANFKAGYSKGCCYIITQNFQSVIGYLQSEITAQINQIVNRYSNSGCLQRKFVFLASHKEQLTVHPADGNGLINNLASFVETNSK